jgi:fructuronate reductase
MALGVAAWMHYLRGVDEANRTYAIDDPHAKALTGLYQRSIGRELNLDSVQAMLAYTPVFGDLEGNATLANTLLWALQSLQAQGVAGTLLAVNRGEIN